MARRCFLQDIKNLSAISFKENEMISQKISIIINKKTNIILIIMLKNDNKSLFRAFSVRMSKRGFVSVM
jgi:hypothetical protein